LISQAVKNIIVRLALVAAAILTFVIPGLYPFEIGKDRR